MRPRFLAWIAALLAFVTRTDAFVQYGDGAPVAGGGLSAICSAYARFASGIPNCATTFPITIFAQNPSKTGFNGGGYSNVATAAKGYGFDGFIGIDGGCSSGTFPCSFGDHGGREMAAAKAAGMWFITSGEGQDNTSANSVASVQAAAGAVGTLSNLVGYSEGDEAVCGAGFNTDHTAKAGTVAAAVNKSHIYDPTRPVFYNQTGAVLFNPFFPNMIDCSGDGGASQTGAFTSPDVTSFDIYPNISPWLYFAHSGVNVAGSDFTTHSFDHLWLVAYATARGLAVNGGKPLWGFVNSGGDAFSYSSSSNYFNGTISSGAATITNTRAPEVQFTDALYAHPPGGTALIVTDSLKCLPANTRVSSIADATHLVLNKNAATPCTANTADVFFLTGGTGKSSGGCNLGLNLCAPFGNEFRDQFFQVSAVYWALIINGATGIEIFCHDSISYSFCLGDRAGGTAASDTAHNLSYINEIVHKFGATLNKDTIAKVSLQNSDATASTSVTKTDAILTLTSSSAKCPAWALLKPKGTGYELFIQSGRIGCGATAYGVRIGGRAGSTMTLVYDQRSQYDNAHAIAPGTTKALNETGEANITIGDGGDAKDDYDVQVWDIK